MNMRQVVLKRIGHESHVRRICYIGSTVEFGDTLIHHYVTGVKDMWDNRRMDISYSDPDLFDKLRVIMDEGSRMAKKYGHTDRTLRTTREIQ